MQNYYNIPKYSAGGFLLKMVEKGLKNGALSYRGLQAQANSFAKSVPELKGLLKKLIDTSKSGQKLSHEEGKKLIDLLQEHKGTYKSLNNLIPKNWKGTKQKVDKITSKAAENTKQVENAVKEATETQVSNPIPGTTLSARWKQAKTWMNNHPKTTIGVPLLALGTGPGRYVTGNAVKAIQSNPENWFNDVPSQSGEASDFIVIDGTRIPIKRSAEGYFVPVTQDNVQVPSVGGDNIDQTLAGITNENLGGTPQQQQGNMPVVDQQAINDLFEDDQW